MAEVISVLAPLIDFPCNRKAHDSLPSCEGSVSANNVNGEKPFVRD